jgi:hypothetical protein
MSQVKGTGTKRNTKTPSRLARIKYKASLFIHFQTKRRAIAAVIPDNPIAMQRKYCMPRQAQGT